MEWNPIQYEKFLKDRTLPAHDLVSRIADFCPNTVLDIGCGSGNSTQLLHEFFPTAKVIGADNSDEMLSKAKKNCPELEFINLDASGDLFELNSTFDLIFSNACLQWIPNHQELLPKLFRFLNKGGRFAVQIPLQEKHPMHGILKKLANSEKWKKCLEVRKYNVLTTEEYFDILSAFTDDFELWETTYCHRMPNYESIIEWYKGTGFNPYLEQLSSTQSEDFLNDVRFELKKMYKVQLNGEILFRFPRLFFVAKRK